MKKIVFLLFVLLSSTHLIAQQEASNWYFGDNAGIRFNQDGTITALSDGQLATDEGCTSISDGNGNLLFYTDGRTVYDRNNNQMPNGFGLAGDSSSTQSALIVPKPQDPDIYYIFTVDTTFFGDPDVGFNYSEVDMTLNGGNGDVIQKNINLLQDSSEKLSAVLKDCQTQSIWVVTLANEFGTTVPPNTPGFNTFHAFEVTTTGVNTTAVTSVFPTLNIGDQRGYLKFSPNGEQIACANSNSGLYLFDFDTATGLVSSSTAQPLRLNINATNNAVFPYGVEFSQSGQYLYVSSSNNFFANNPPGANDNPVNHFASLVQFDIRAANIQASQVLIDQRNSYRSALQLGPDGKIYRTTSTSYANGTPFLSVINNPDAQGLASNYVHNAIPLANNSRQGLPPFITSFFVENIDIINDPDITSINLPLCTADTYTLNAENIPGATYTWSLDGVVQPTPPIPYEFEVIQNGLYEVLIELNNGDCETQEGAALVEYFTFPEAFTPQDIDVCDTDGINDGLSRFDDFDQQTTAILGAAQDPSDYIIRYYRSLNDADLGRDEITFPFTNTVNNEEIFVRVENIDNGNCFITDDTTTGQTISFFLNVFDTPEIIRFDDIDECDMDGDTTDGIISLVLSDFNADILGADQSAADFDISYHATQADALSGNSPLPNNYQTTAFSDNIWVRMENVNNPSCDAVQGISIIINLTPEIVNTGIFQCDEDGTPDGRTIFNISELNDTITNANPNFTVDYYLNITDATAETNAIDATNYTNVSSPQLITARVTDTTSGCFSFSTVTLEVSATAANDAYIGVCDTDGDEDGFTLFDLSLADDQVLDGLPAGLDLVYYETLDDALVEQNPLPNDYTNEVAFNQTIFVRVENDNNCYGINEVALEVLTLPNVETEFETLYCLNDFPEPIIINGGVFDAVPNNFYYEWSTGETTIEIEVNEPGIYTVIVRNVAGCSKERTVTVTASNIATITDIQVTDATENNTITVLVTGEGDYEFALDDPNGFYQDSNVFNNVLPGIYSVFVRDKNGCGITEEMVSVVGFPKFFTPNGDNQNDFWQVKGISSQFQPNTVIYIFDKYGKLVSEINPLGSGWDGTYNGNPLPSSDYWFSVTLQDGRQFSSHFALKR
ncbi:MAG: gliding motility-associated C-terminal domain-containing protein [Winogradskyella sp.]|uniref:T9SS type B sorting domain-containing protein n=1 Tax=Winogradskyella sp. TaxID=1883156 RepID=UPI000F3F7E1C|nr:T9SS type B sorting domain-containing protein [Winogradskyella sp.]RNC84904.1 MAG: gliding motility-associated C-terminal domain-containing protein [Winogradskyella sp.]